MKSSHRNTRRWAAWKISLAAGFMVALTACEASDGPTGVDTSFDPTVTINGVELITASVTGHGLVMAGSSTSKEIDDDGGTVSIDGAQLRIPEDALRDDTVIKMATSGDQLWAYDFGPAGLQFEKTATLSIEVSEAQLKAAGIDPSRLGAAYAPNSSSSSWQIVGSSYDRSRGLLHVPVRHFSRYALCVE